MESQRQHETVQPSPDIVFDLLGHRYRRLLLVCLRETDRPLQLRTVAEEIAAWDDARAPADVPEPEVARVRSMLYHGHVPKLREHEIVSFDREDDTVTLEARATHLDPYLDLAVDGTPDF